MSVKLELLNRLLASIGSSSINSVVGRHPALIRAEPVLERANNTVQARGHWFNTDYSLRLLKDTETLDFVLPNGTLNADTTEKSLSYVRRGNRMYDPKDNTFDIKEDYIDVDVVIKLDYEDLPVIAYDYIGSMGSLEMVSNSDADSASIRYHTALAERTYLNFERERVRQADVTLRDNPTYARIMSGVYYNRGVSRTPNRIGG